MNAEKVEVAKELDNAEQTDEWKEILSAINTPGNRSKETISISRCAQNRISFTHCSIKIL